MKRSLLALSLGLAFGLCAFNTSVFAADSSGTYSGSIKCTVYADDGTKFKTGRQDLIVLVKQEETVELVSNLNINFNLLSATSKRIRYSTEKIRTVMFSITFNTCVIFLLRFGRVSMEKETSDNTIRD